MTEESYTSKASFVDNDEIPVFDKKHEKHTFSGKRVSRGSYRTGKGFFVNADINGAANILKKSLTLFPEKERIPLDCVNVWQPKVIS